MNRVLAMKTYANKLLISFTSQISQPINIFTIFAKRTLNFHNSIGTGPIHNSLKKIAATLPYLMSITNILLQYLSAQRRLERENET